MIPIKDHYGHTLIEIDEKRFPLKMEAVTKFGSKEYKINITYVKDSEGKPTKTIKSVNMTA